MPAPIGGFVTVDQKQPDHYVDLCWQRRARPAGPRLLSGRDRKGKREIQQKYRDYLTFLLGKAGYRTRPDMARAVYDFEDQIARKVTWDRASRRNRDLTYNARDPRGAGRADRATSRSRTMLDGIGLGARPTGSSSRRCRQRRTRASRAGARRQATLAKIGGGTPAMLELLGDYAGRDTAGMDGREPAQSDNAAVLPTRIDEANFEFYGKTLQRQAASSARAGSAPSPKCEGQLGERARQESTSSGISRAENKAAMDRSGRQPA